MNHDSEPTRRKVWRRILSWSARAVLAVCLLFYLSVYLFQEAKLFEPRKTPTGYVARPDLDPVGDEFLELSTAMINYQKFEACSDTRRGAIFFLHGNRGNIRECRWLIEPFLMAGYDVWTMDYRGFGASTGRVSEATLLADVQMVYKRIRQDEDEGGMIVWGRSLGSGMAAFIASGNSPRALVLETPYWSLPDAARQRYPMLPSFLFRYHLPTHEYLANVDCPVYLIHGTQDEKIGFPSSVQLEQRCKQLGLQVQLHVISNGRHNLRSEPEFARIRREILKQISLQ
jgi:hypothetical protein